MNKILAIEIKKKLKKQNKQEFNMATTISYYELMYQITRHPGLVFLSAKTFTGFLTHLRVWNLWRNKTCML